MKRVARLLLLALFTACVAVRADSTPSVIFLDGNAARSAIVNDARDGYFDKLESIEIAAKVGEALTGSLAEQRREARRRYQQAVRPFRPEEKQAIRAYIDALQPLLLNYPHYSRQPWKFVKVADHIEGGLPHTRDDFIVLPENASKGLFDMRARLSPEQALMRGGMLLLHEQAHVLQRLDPMRFESLYTKTFGYRRNGKIPLPDDLRLNQVANPDGMDCCWLFPRGSGMIWPFLVFAERDGIRRMPTDFRMLAVQLELPRNHKGYRVVKGSDGSSATEELLQVRDYVEAFPLTQNFYHPNETAADLFSQLVLFDGIAGPRMAPAQREALEREFSRLRPAFLGVLGR